jgi:alginate O-acetyltransferase complex protein AlgI
LGLFGIGMAFVTLAPVIQDRNRAIPVVLLLVITLFIMLKSEPLVAAWSGWVRSQTGRPLSLAQAGELQWLGFSYLAFRLIHTLRDRQTGRLPDLSLREYLTYMIFFPAYTAGPIDRAERFIKDYRALTETPIFVPARLMEGAGRITSGIIKKFVIADYLALFALNAINATQAESTFGLWILLYGYAFRLFFDFSGYSDIAIGLGILFGIKLPENFNQPYLKSNITAFWQSWHITLSTWARFYIFTPLSRVLMNQNPKPSPTMIVLIAQLVTMVTIGLWHGITINFVVWGLWHGIGLYMHKLWSDRTRTFYQQLNERPRQRQLVNVLGVIGTFHFVALGWVWFALPDPALSINVMLKLFGVR